ncbi:MAG: L-aspartate oxidase [Deltaproteobacteria bacterium]|nr:L-aspartate oxidase [Deltaproteobacteria bacterium]
MARESDILIIGSGVAGLTAALNLSKFARVTIITKKEADDTSTSQAQGGIATVLDSADRFEYHIRDTHTAGAGLCRSEAVESIVREGPQAIRELIDFGARFNVSAKGELDLGREGGHSHRRIVHAADMTGREVERALLQTVRTSDRIDLLENHTALNLVTAGLSGGVKGTDATPENRCIGCYVHSAESGEVIPWSARAVILASGGSGKVYLYTSNPEVATGAGVAMAYRAGADVANMEFIQFHPTCLFHPEAKSFLISEAVRGEGAVLRTMDGEAFMERYHPMKDLAPRDIVARAIDSELKKSGDDYVLLDSTHKPAKQIMERFPNIYERCLQLGYDMTKESIPVVPAAHYTCGGVLTDMDGKTTVPGLFACGEVACTGLHGANRLASNSLLEAVVMADHIADALKRDWGAISSAPMPHIPDWDPGDAVDSDEQVVITHNWDEIRRTMWNYVGIVRTNRRLERAKHRIDLLQREVDEYYWNFRITRELIELRNLVTVGSLIVRCAMARKESRGLHFTLDYPESDDSLKFDTIINRKNEETRR